jgi:hypothetical protein
MAVKSPSSCCPENQSTPETTNDIATASSMNKSDCLNIIFLFYRSVDAIAEITQPKTAIPASVRSPEWPAKSKIANSIIPSKHNTTRTSESRIRPIPNRTESVLKWLSKVTVSFI